MDDKKNEHQPQTEYHPCPILYLVVPCYNEEEILQYSVDKLLKKLETLEQSQRIMPESRIVLVDDGSNDDTWHLIEELHMQQFQICGLRLSKNEGHQCAVFAGLMFAKDKADVAISIDADLQQDINAIDEMLKQYQQGSDIVYGVRNDRESDGFTKRISALGFYALMKCMGTNVIKNHADYRLLSRQALESLAKYDEYNLFLRGLIPELGYESSVIHFDVKERVAGSSKYTLKKMLKLAADGITSFSIRPMQIVLCMGIVILAISIAMLLSTVVAHFMGKTISGWSSTICSIWFLGGVQVLALGIIGEYIGKIYLETKHRPKYHIRSCLWKS